LKETPRTKLREVKGANVLTDVGASCYYCARCENAPGLQSSSAAKRHKGAVEKPAPNLTKGKAHEKGKNYDPENNVR
jgi:hypothetical protein